MCVASIQHQTFTDFEVWIVDGDSTDGTKEYLQTLEKPFYFISEKDNGIYDAMNKGISLSEGRWLYFMGADDQLYSNNVLSNLFHSDINNAIDIYSGKVKYCDGDTPFIYSKKMNIKNPSWNFSMWIRNGLHHQGTFYKKEIFTNNLFKLEYKVLADYAFNLRAYRKKMKFLETHLIIAKCSGDGVSKSGNWSIYKEEYLMKVKESSLVFGIFHYLIISIKFLLRKYVNAL